VWCHPKREGICHAFCPIHGYKTPANPSARGTSRSEPHWDVLRNGFRDQGPETVSSFTQRTGSNLFRTQGPEIVLSLCAAVWKEPEDPRQQHSLTIGHLWEAIPVFHPTGGTTRSPEHILQSSLTGRVLGETTKIVTQRIGDKNIVPYVLAQLSARSWCASIRWEGIVTLLNTLGRSGVDDVAMGFRSSISVLDDSSQRTFPYEASFGLNVTSHLVSSKLR